MSLGSQLSQIQQSRMRFDDILTAARTALAQGDLDDSAALLQVAAQYASTRHTGLFRSLELEEMAGRIGRSVAPGLAQALSGPLAARRRILHVATEVYPIGGHTRVIWNWIGKDAGSEHHVALTQQGSGGVPPRLAELTASSGGQIHRLDGGTRSLRTVAARLGGLAVGFDVVVLHIHPFDITPLLAFAVKDRRPPLAFYNHADHVFGVCGGIADAFADMRDAGRRISLGRRQIRRASSVLLPIPLGLPARALSRARAKETLGFSARELLAVSVGDACKFQPFAGVDFVEAHQRLLELVPDLRYLGRRCFSEQPDGPGVGRPVPWASQGIRENSGTWGRASGRGPRYWILFP